MPAITTTIDRDQRDGLYELVRNHLGSIEDFWIALERTKNFAKAEQLGSPKTPFLIVGALGLLASGATLVRSRRTV